MLLGPEVPQRLPVSRTFFAYHLSEDFGPFSGQNYYTNDGTAEGGDQVFIVSGKRAADKGKDYILEGLFRVVRRDQGRYVRNDRQGRPETYIYHLLLSPVRVPDSPIPLNRADWYDREEVRRYFASGQNFNPLPKDYRERFDVLLAGYGQSSTDELAEDLEELRHRDITPTERQVLTQARIGQGRFRADVTKLWGGTERCTLTGIALPEMLVASHIKPWRDSNDAERLDPANGLLLAAHADKLFDRYLMSLEVVSEGLKCVIAPAAIEAAKATQLKSGVIIHLTYLSLSLGAKVERYMRGHHERFLERLERQA
ncbi:hypothetical protein CDL60_14305 [Roseateles noduli]|nr:hypothetical protein CDL60_14305 [Roseateles noduli]